MQEALRILTHHRCGGGYGPRTGGLMTEVATGIEPRGMRLALHAHDKGAIDASAGTKGGVSSIESNPSCQLALSEDLIDNNGSSIHADRGPEHSRRSRPVCCVHLGLSKSGLHS